ncbi:(deoxy)nucleoside triphosphate pyrophosphohydrolase [Thiosulfativibrio zosterae]|uniref:8-oxo-dGTP diphosphatase n=1 Tax=Thiosulfativibrio zosterae TaxID=2675053 RepID=A0A6F8PNA6_9GAMM|nr:(deoxy)nucleoside triphosphate pyrophosphohydrolase [Thiosulfativibrio zosterae]BBP43524.1 NUDIX hydrolase [Thiosulfativibrio zosterae]
MSKNLNIKQVTAAIAIQNGKVLITRRATNEKLAGLWEFPGGKLEANETLFECIEREIKEELGVLCLAKEIFTEAIYEYEFGAIKLIAIFIEFESTEFKLTVHDQAEWCFISELGQYELAPADIPIAKELIKCHQ